MEMHKSKSQSGAQQRKVKEARKKSLKTQAGSMFQYVKNAEDGQDSSKDTAHPSPVDVAASSDASMHPAEEQNVEMEELESEENAESDSGPDTVSEMSDVEEEDLQIFRDVYFWEIPVPDHLQIAIIKRGSASFQNKDGPFSVAARQDAKAEGDVHQLSKEWFYIMPHSEKIMRSWLVYSLVSEKLYCFCCRLFADSVTDRTSAFVTGFQTWWKLNLEVHEHETSEEHLSCFEKWRVLAVKLGPHKTMGTESSALRKKEQKWRDILHKLLHIILFLAKQNLPFGVQEEEEDETSLNNGNFLQLVEFFSKYDCVLKEHLVELQQNGCELNMSLYLSPDTQNEFISALANHVKEKLVMDIKSAGYFGIMFDCRTDISQIERMSELIRYVKISNGEVEVKEVFLGFLLLERKNAAELGSDILKGLEKDGLDIMLCCAQGYDNNTLSRIHRGVQALIKEKNKKAIFNGYVDHSLNLCGWRSFAENLLCMMFFGTLDRLFSFFAASTCRWDVLIDHIGVSVDRLSTTRWCAHHAAVKPVKENFGKLVEALETFFDPQEDWYARGEAQRLWQDVSDFTFLCFLYFWCDVLQEVNLTQQYMQTKGLPLDKVVTKLEALELFLHKERSHLVERAIEQALLKCEEHEIEVERVVWKRRMAEEQASDTELIVQENKKAMLECIDGFQSELQIRSGAIKEVATMFEAVQAKSLVSATKEELKVSIPKLTTFYDELSEAELLKEIPRLRTQLKAAKIDLEEAKDWATLDFLKFIAKCHLVERLPTLSLSLKLFLTICVSVVSCERNSLKLELIQDHLQSAMGQTEMSDIAILSIENKLAESIDFSEVIHRFAALKVREGKF